MLRQEMQVATPLEGTIYLTIKNINDPEYRE